MDTIKCQIACNFTPQYEIKKIKKTVLNHLASVGFADIQPDWVSVSFISKEQMEAECEGAAGYHTSTDIFNESIKVVEEQNISEIYATLAHEYLHAWQMQNKLPEFIRYREHDRFKNLCEGFAQLGSFLIFKRFSEKGDWYSTQRLHQMFMDTRPGYGIAFQLLHKRLGVIGWPAIIKEARQHKLVI